jgi:hypothetical protein
VTVLLDPLTRREVSIPALEGAWLPTVDPVGRYVAYWQGVLAWDGQTVAPVSGRLWIGSWPAIEPRAQPIPTPTPDGDRGRPSPTPRPSQTAAPATAVRWPLDPAAGTVVDWRIRWADDGLAVGLWLAASPDARVGQLTVLTPPDPRTQEASVLLAPTPAGEGAFAMGLDRVAWVVPLGTAAGELRVATWGPLGSGGVRLRQLDGLGVPAF